MSFVVDARTIKHALGFASALHHVAEVKFLIGDRKLSIRTVDTSNVAMAHISIPIDSDDEYVIGVNIGRFLDALGTVRKTDVFPVTFEAVEYKPEDGKSRSSELDENPKRLKMSYGSYTFKLKYINPESIRKESKVPTLELGNHVNISTKLLKSALNRTFGTYVLIENKDGDFIVQSDSDEEEDNSCYKSSLGVYGNTSDTSTLLSMETLVPIVKEMACAADTVVLSHGQDYPITLEAAFGKDDKASVKFLMAPRIESE